MSDDDRDRTLPSPAEAMDASGAYAPRPGESYTIEEGGNGRKVIRYEGDTSPR